MLYEIAGFASLTNIILWVIMKKEYGALPSLRDFVGRFTNLFLPVSCIYIFLTVIYLLVPLALFTYTLVHFKKLSTNNNVTIKESYASFSMLYFMSLSLYLVFIQAEFCKYLTNSQFNYLQVMIGSIINNGVRFKEVYRLLSFIHLFIMWFLTFFIAVEAWSYYHTTRIILSLRKHYFLICVWVITAISYSLLLGLFELRFKRLFPVEYSNMDDKLFNRQRTSVAFLLLIFWFYVTLHDYFRASQQSPDRTL